MAKTEESGARVLYSKLIKNISEDIESIRSFFRLNGLPDAVSLVWAESDYRKAGKLAKEYDFNGRIGKLGDSLINLRKKIEVHPAGLEALAYASGSWNLSHR